MTMEAMKVIGVTGGIGSGKSTVVRILAELGASVVDADKVGHELYQPGAPVWHEVVAAFGQDILKPNGEIDRAKLGAIVFNDPEALRRLNAIMHPKIFERCRQIFSDWLKDGVQVAVLEAAVLLEAGWTPLVDEIWVTVASEAVVIERLKQAKGFSPEASRARLRSQLPVEQKIKAAQVVIHNNGDLSELRQQVIELWQRLQ